jgi:TetR/AcrR family transcriptional regulator, repressor for uid operon
MTTRTKKSTRRGRPVDEEARAERRDHILAAARRCFAAKGFHASSTADISAAAEVSVANLYQYFASKEDLILAMAEQDLASDLALVDNLKAAKDLFSGVDDALVAVADQAASKQSFGLRMEIFAEAVRNPKVRRALAAMEARVCKALAGVIAEGQARGDLRTDITPQDSAALVACLMDGFYSAAGIGLLRAASLRVPAREFIRHALGRSRA